MAEIKPKCGKCKKEKPCSCGRPTKLAPKFIRIAKEVLGIREEGMGLAESIEDMHAIIHTDGDLIFLINERLEESERVSEEAWQEWKSGNTQNSQGLEFRLLLKKALMQQRSALLLKMEEENPKAWQKWAWILERKFSEWNLQRKSLLGEDPENRFKGLADLMKVQNE